MQASCASASLLTNIALSTSTRQAKRRSRIDRNAISGPMGDFRHTMHIGRGGDAFGDTSFLATPKPVMQSSSADPLLGADGSTIDGFTHPTADTVLPVRSGSECSSNSRSNESLPMVNQPQITRTLNGHSKGHRNSGSDVESYDNYMCVATQPAATSTSPSVSGDPMLSFDLDLGPSMLDDILSWFTYKLLSMCSLKVTTVVFGMMVPRKMMRYTSFQPF
uniref:CRIB domain-containing protein n=1 Tax=Eptatretus burgeri TaxID=7764 RepID=A0A8C4N9D9_EPTBU